MNIEKQQIIINGVQKQILILPQDYEQSWTFKEFIDKIIHKKLGWSSRVFIYQYPICSFNKVDYLKTELTLGQIQSQIGKICVTYNNTQYVQEPSYHNAQIYSSPTTKDTLQFVVQICQNNYFVHENYRFPTSTRIGFFEEICRRYGTEIHVQYYNTRFPLNLLSKQSVIEHTLTNFVDETGRVTISVNSIQLGNLWFQSVKNKQNIDLRFYFLMEINDTVRIQSFVVSRKCKRKSLLYLFNLIYKQQVELLDENNNNTQSESFQKQNKVKAIISKQKKFNINLQQSIPNCQIVGALHSKNKEIMQVFAISNSSILYRIFVNKKMRSCKIRTITRLPTVKTEHLDEDLFFLKGETLISFEILVKMIKIKQFTLDGELLCIRIYPWYHELYQVQFSVIDLFCVRLKNDKNKVRVFYIDDPQNYVEVVTCDKFFPAKVGNGVTSDGSGVFAISNNFTQGLQIYELPDQIPKTQIKIDNYKLLSDVFFSEKSSNFNRTLFLNFSNSYISVYGLPKGQNIIKIVTQKGMSNFFSVGSYLACSSGNQMRIFKQNPKNKKLQWTEPVHIPEKSVLLFSNNDNFLIREKTVQLNNFNSFFLLNTQ